MAISRVGTGAAEASSVTFASSFSTTAGDLIVVWAYSSSTTIPTIPSGYITITATAGTQQAVACGWKVSTGSETSTGTWTNATSIDAVIYRGASVVGAVSALQSGSSTTATIAALTLQNTSGSSWVVATVGAKSNGSSGNFPGTVGTTPVLTKVATTTTSCAYDSTTGVTSYSGTTCAFSPTSRWFSITIELLVLPPNPYFIAAGTISAATSGSITPPLPTGVLTNDILLAIGHSSNQTVSIISGPGWTEIDDQTHMGTGTAATAGSVRIAVFWKRATGSDTLQLSTGGDHIFGQMLCFRGCETIGNPWSDVGTEWQTFSSVTSGGGWGIGGTSGNAQWINGSSVTYSANFSTTKNNSLVVAIFGHARDSGTAQSGTFTATLLTGFAGLSGCDVSTATGTGGGFSVGAGSSATSGSVADGTHTINTGWISSSSVSQATMVLALIIPQPIIPLPSLVTQPMAPSRRRLFR